MTAREIPHRIARALRARLERLGLGRLATVPEPDLAFMPEPWLPAHRKVAAAPCLAAARKIAAGKLDIFALRDVEIGWPPRWNREPKNSIDVPMTFGKSLDYRDPSLAGDIKYLWEPNRHQHLVALAQAYALSADAGYLAPFRDQLDSWLEACPYRMGPNWSSALEAAIRLVNWSLAWQLLGGIDSPLFDDARGQRLRERWLASVYRHCHFVRGHFSLHSSANNHLIGEAVGLYVAAATWPHWPASEAWRSRAKAVIEREAVAQNGSDGVNREQAVAYQQFEFDLLLLAVLASRADDSSFSIEVLDRMQAMLDYLAAIMDVGGNVPAFGDSDDGFVVKLVHQTGFCSYRSILAAGALLFRSGRFKQAAQRLDDKTRWLFGEDADASFDALPPDGAAATPRAFPEGGYYVLGDRFGTHDEIKLVADAGPLGYGTLAAHGHADALAFTLSLGGREIFVDPGTYTYRADSPWRAFFRGTSAHNTVRLDGRDQSEPGGNFMWIDKARARCTAWHSSAASDVFEGWHDGYLRLGDPVKHWRRITLHKRDRRVVIEDGLDMNGEHSVELFFHCGEHCTVEPGGHGYTIRHGDRCVQLTLPENGRARLYAGETEPPLGWMSRRFGCKTPSPTVAWRARVRGNTVLRSEIAY